MLYALSLSISQLLTGGQECRRQRHISARVGEKFSMCIVGIWIEVNRHLSISQRQTGAGAGGCREWCRREWCHREWRRQRLISARVGEKLSKRIKVNRRWPWYGRMEEHRT